jgi:hypothetical protein
MPRLSPRQQLKMNKDHERPVYQKKAPGQKRSQILALLLGKLMLTHAEVLRRRPFAQVPAGPMAHRGCAASNRNWHSLIAAHLEMLKMLRHLLAVS